MKAGAFLHTGGTGTRRNPGEPGIWVFILGDVLVFTFLLCVFVSYRAQDTELYRQSQQALRDGYGLINTFLLLTSSWLVAKGLAAARFNQQRAAVFFFAGGLAGGAGFAVVKFVEYREKLLAGVTLVTNEFFMFYYVITILHLLHLIVGMAVLAYLLRKAGRGEFSARDIVTYECGGAYWHMVDLLWVVIFPLLYLIK